MCHEELLVDFIMNRSHTFVVIEALFTEFNIFKLQRKYIYKIKPVDLKINNFLSFCSGL